MTELPGHWQVMPSSHILGDNQGVREAATLISMAFSCPQIHNRVCSAEFGSAYYFSFLCPTFPLLCNTDLTLVVHGEKRTSIQRWFWELNCKESEPLRSKLQWGSSSSGWRGVCSVDRVPEDWIQFWVSSKDLQPREFGWDEMNHYPVSRVRFSQAPPAITMPESSPVVSLTCNCRFSDSNRQAQHTRLSKLCKPTTRKDLWHAVSAGIRALECAQDLKHTM